MVLKYALFYEFLSWRNMRVFLVSSNWIIYLIISVNSYTILTILLIDCETVGINRAKESFGERLITTFSGRQ